MNFRISDARMLDTYIYIYIYILVYTTPDLWMHDMEVSWNRLVCGLEHEFVFFPSYWECHHPNWRSPSFFRGVGLNHQPVDVTQTYHPESMGSPVAGHQRGRIRPLQHQTGRCGAAWVEKSARMVPECQTMDNDGTSIYIYIIYNIYTVYIYIHIYILYVCVFACVKT